MIRINILQKCFDQSIHFSKCIILFIIIITLPLTIVPNTKKNKHFSIIFKINNFLWSNLRNKK